MKLILGGSGFIGSNLVQELLLQKQKVRVFDKKPFPTQSESQPDEMVGGDILVYEDLLAAMVDCDTVYHLAGTPELWNKDPEVFEKLNHQGTLSVLKAARQSQIKRFVFTSTESILASPIKNQMVNEDVQPVIGDMIGPYCRSKLLAENAVFKAAANGLDAIVVCPTLPIGPGDRNLTPPGRMISDFLNGKIPAYLDCTLNFADVRDMAKWHVLAAEKGESGKRYILSGYNFSVFDFFRQLSRESGIPYPKFKVPYFVALGWSYIEDYWGRLTGRKPQSSTTGVKLCKRSMAFDGTWTWKILGHHPRPFKESIRDAIAWHRQYMHSN